MPLPLLAAAASAGASTLKNVNAPGNNAMALHRGGHHSLNFQQMMTAMQQAGINLKDLMALNGPGLQAKLKSLTPQQQQALVQQLSGASLTMQGPGGTQVNGQVKNVNLNGATPSFDVAGNTYTLDKIESINQAAA